VIRIERQIKGDPELSSFMDLISMTPIALPSSPHADVDKYETQTEHKTGSGTKPDLRPEPWDPSKAVHSTVFAPTNEAFEKTFDELDRRYLWSEWAGEARRKILQSHLVADAIPSKGEVVQGEEDRLPMVGWRSAFIGKNSTDGESAVYLIRACGGSTSRAYNELKTISSDR
jgi:hypothetical protein